MRIKLADRLLTILKAVTPDAAGPSDASNGTDDWQVLGNYELPEDAQPEAIFAKVEDGELFLSVPRAVPVSSTLSYKIGYLQGQA